MNIQHLRYAVEVEKTRSITEAAENLYMGQPNLSRAIRELESVLNIKVFDRTSKGIVPTSQGEEFLHYARSILAQFDEMTAHYQQPHDHPQALRLSVPRASYISQAFASFAQKADPRLVLDYKETNALRAIRNVTEDGYELGIVRYQASYEKYFLRTFAEKGLNYREIWSFRYRALMRADHPAALKPSVTLADLEDSVEITHGDSYVPSLPPHNQPSEHSAARRILVYERGSQFDLLSTLPKAYMWVSPVPSSLLDRWGLVQPPCIDHTALHKDVLIYRKQYILSPLDEQFLEELEQARKELRAIAPFC